MNSSLEVYRNIENVMEKFKCYAIQKTDQFIGLFIISFCHFLYCFPKGYFSLPL